MKDDKKLIFVPIVAIILIIALILSVTFLGRKTDEKKYYKTILHYSEKYSLKPELVLALVKAESNFDKDAISDKGAVGLMQIMPETAAFIAEKLVGDNDKIKVIGGKNKDSASNIADEKSSGGSDGNFRKNDIDYSADSAIGSGKSDENISGFGDSQNSADSEDEEYNKSGNDTDSRRENEGDDEEDIKVIDLKNPECNINIGCAYLYYLRKKFDDESVILCAYNAGEGNVRKWLADSRYSSDGMTLYEVPFEETAEYVKKIAKLQKRYKNYLKKKGYYGQKDKRQSV